MDDGFEGAYGEVSSAFARAVAAFGPQEVMRWAEGLGQEVFVGSTGRVFPVAMKASPLLRAWLGRLDGRGVALRTRWRWAGWRDGRAVFDTPEGPREIDAEITVLAMGGASWRRLGSGPSSFPTRWRRSCPPTSGCGWTGRRTWRGGTASRSRGSRSTRAT